MPLPTPLQASVKSLAAACWSGVSASNAATPITPANAFSRFFMMFVAPLVASTAITGEWSWRFASAQKEKAGFRPPFSRLFHALGRVFAHQLGALRHRRGGRVRARRGLAVHRVSLDFEVGEQCRLVAGVRHLALQALAPGIVEKAA